MAKLNPKTKKAVAAAVRAARGNPKRNPIIEGRGFLTASTIKKKAKSLLSKAKRTYKDAEPYRKAFDKATRQADRDELGTEWANEVLVAAGVALAAEEMALLVDDISTARKAQSLYMEIWDGFYPYVTRSRP